MQSLQVVLNDLKASRVITDDRVESAVTKVMADCVITWETRQAVTEAILIANALELQSGDRLAWTGPRDDTLSSLLQELVRPGGELYAAEVHDAVDPFRKRLSTGPAGECRLNFDSLPPDGLALFTHQCGSVYLHMVVQRALTRDLAGRISFVSASPSADFVSELAAKYSELPPSYPDSDDGLWPKVQDWYNPGWTFYVSANLPAMRFSFSQVQTQSVVWVTDCSGGVLVFRPVAPHISAYGNTAQLIGQMKSVYSKWVRTGRPSMSNYRFALWPKNDAEDALVQNPELFAPRSFARSDVVAIFSTRIDRSTLH